MNNEKAQPSDQEQAPNRNLEAQPLSLKRTFFFMLGGFLMFTADLIPGVSGSTVLLILRLYSRFVHALSDLLFFPKDLLQKPFKHSVLRLHLDFFIPFGVAYIVGALVLSSLLFFLLKTHASFLFSLFFGLTLSSVFFLLHRAKPVRALSFLWFFAGLVPGVLVAHLPLLSWDFLPEVLRAFVAGALGAVFMIIPGISGSLVLLSLGLYEFAIEAVAERDVVLMGALLFGALFSLLLFSRLIAFLIDTYMRPIFLIMAGLLFGALFLLFPWQNEHLSSTLVYGSMTVNSIIYVFLMFFGAALVVLLNYFGKKVQ